jgi:hypothetical protein
MEQVKLKEIRDMDVFRFSKYESNCLKMGFRADNKIGFISVSKKLYYADEDTLVYRSDDPYTNPKFRTTPSPKNNK